MLNKIRNSHWIHSTCFCPGWMSVWPIFVEIEHNCLNHFICTIDIKPVSFKNSVVCTRSETLPLIHYSNQPNVDVIGL